MECRFSSRRYTSGKPEAAKAVLRGKFIAIQAFLKKEERSQMDNLTLHLNELEKEEQKSPKVSRRKEIIKIKEEINKRNNGILKVKSFKHADILCTDVIEGDGKYKGTLGLIKCDYKGYELGVGSGFTDEQRHYYWNHRDEIIGKIVQIKYKGETQNKQGGLSVQFPIFQTVRYDKVEPSYN